MYNLFTPLPTIYMTIRFFNIMIYLAIPAAPFISIYKYIVVSTLTTNSPITDAYFVHDVTYFRGSIHR